MTAPPIGYYGAKGRIAQRLIDLFPAHEGYVEPFAGSLAVLLAKQPVGFEVVNDLDGRLMTFWRVLRERREELADLCALTPHSRAEYASAWPVPMDVTDDLEVARRVWVKLTQGRGGSLRSTGWRYYQASGDSMPRQLGSYVDRIPPAAQRLANVSLECLPALEVIERYGRDPKTLLYVDPPYLFETRSKSGMYAHEMGSTSEHSDLAAAVLACHAAVVVSGYASPLYDDLFGDWHRTEIATTSGQGNDRGDQARTEVVWSNRPFPEPAADLLDIFTNEAS